MNNINEEVDLQARYTGEIILMTRQLESLLHRITGSEAAGIHALTEVCGARLPEYIRRQLHYVAAVRNQAAHEDSFSITLEEFGRFKQTVRDLQQSLEKLFPDAAFSTADESTADDPESEYAVERELFARIARKLARWGYFPVIGTVYLLYLLLCALCAQGYLVILMLLYGCSVVLGIRAYQSESERGLLYVAGGAFAFVWIVTMILSSRSKKSLWPAFINFLPGINIIYLLQRWLAGLCWGKFLIALCGLTAFVFGIWAFGGMGWPAALTALAVSWVLSAAAAVCWGKQGEK